MQKIASILFKCGEDVGEGSYVAFANSKGGIDAFEKSGYTVKKLNPNEIDLTDIGIPGIIMATFELSAEKFNKNRWRMDSHIYISDYNVVVNVKDYMNFLDKKVNLGIIHQVGAEMGGAPASDVRRVFLDKILRLNAFDVRTGKSEYVRVFNLFDSLNLFHDFERDINDRLGVRPSDAEYAQEERDLIAITYSSGAETREDAVLTDVQGDSNSETYSEQSELNDMLNRLDNGQAYNGNGQVYDGNVQVYNGGYMPVGNVQSGATGFSGGQTYAGRVAGPDGIVKNGALNMSSFNRWGSYGGSYGFNSNVNPGGSFGNVYSGNGDLGNSLNREMQNVNGVNNGEVNEDAVNSQAEPNTQVQNGQMYDGQQVQNGQVVQNGQMYNGQVGQDMQVQNGQRPEGQVYNGQQAQNGQFYNGQMYNGQKVQNGQVQNGKVHNGQIYNGQPIQSDKTIKNIQQKDIIPPNAKLYIDDGTGVRELNTITSEQMKAISSYLSTGSFEVSDLDNTHPTKDLNNQLDVDNNQINLNKSAMNKSMETQNIGNQVQSKDKGTRNNVIEVSNSESFKSTDSDASLVESKESLSSKNNISSKKSNIKNKKENIQNSEVEKELSELREQVANGEIMSDEATEVETLKSEIRDKAHSNQSDNELSNIKVPEQDNSVIPEAESNLFENEEEQDYLKNSVWYSAMADLQETSLF